ncbi:secreted RxLR effector protein 161-like [Nicotiana tomentosiformis]|uniref:secreted RxLR effector protein 161-like n=1 Tax=Nicotiana tomentosiformis TaxID=4098 RepID=UPI00388CDBBD
MEDSKEIDTPIATSTNLDIDEPGSYVDQKFVGLCARFQANPKESHLTAVKRIFRYLKGTTDLCLWYPKGFLVDRKSTSCMAHFLGSCLVSRATKKENYVILSTAEAEYVGASSCCAQLLWVK